MKKMTAGAVVKTWFDMYLNLIVIEWYTVNEHIHLKDAEKNKQKCSNISVKKYQNRPTFGVKSGTVKLLRKHTHSVKY